MAAPKQAKKSNEKSNENEKKQQQQAPCPGWHLMCEASKKLLFHEDIVCQIKRSKNDNRVMYQANCLIDENGTKKLDPQCPIKVFWLKIEPSYIERHRKSGKNDDETQLTFLENNMAYGISWQVYGDRKNNEYKLTFVALKERPAILKIDPKDGNPKCFGFVDDDNGNKIKTILTDMFVQTRENWVGLPTVKYILLNGINYQNGQKISEKIVR
eukprot:UN04297